MTATTARIPEAWEALPDEEVVRRIYTSDRGVPSVETGATRPLS